MGYHDIADRLALPGPAGYPEEEDLFLISQVWGGDILLQIGDLQRLYSVHLRMVHGAGHTSGHYVLVQSWFPMTSDVAAREALATPVVHHETQGRGGVSQAPEGGICLLLEEYMDA